MSKVNLIALHVILRGAEKGDVPVNGHFTESADEAELLIAAGAARLSDVATAAPVAAAGEKKGKKGAAPAASEPDLEGGDDI